MFRGTQEAKVDEKGRLKLPADFARVIVEKNYGAIFFVTSRDGRKAEIWPMQGMGDRRSEKGRLCLRTIRPSLPGCRL